MNQYDIEAEKSVLGSIITGTAKVDKVRDLLSYGDFYDIKNQYVFRGIEWLRKQDIDVDIVSLNDALKKAKVIDLVGGVAYLSELTNHASSRVIYHARIIADYSSKRKLGKIASDLSSLSNSNDDMSETLSKIKDKIEEVNNLGGKENKYQVASMLDYIDDAKYRFEHWGEMQGLSTGFPSIDMLTLGLVPGELTIVAGASSRGKGLRIDEPVLTPAGMVPIGDISVGDVVYDSDGKETIVEGVYPQGVVDTFKVTFNHNEELVVDGSHLWTVMSDSNWSHKYTGHGALNRNYRKYQTMNTLDIMSRLKDRPWRIPSTKPVEFREKELPLDPYLLGLLLGDGSFRGESGATPVFTTMDTVLLEGFLDNPNILVHELRSKSSGKAKSYSLSGLSGIISKLGLRGTTSHTKFIPKDYLLGSPAQRLAILQGLMDTDGTAGSSNARGASYCTVSDSLKDGVVWLIESLGGAVNIRRKNNKYGGAWIVQVFSYDFMPFRLQRKIDRVNEMTSMGRKRPTIRKIKSIEPIGKSETVCIAVRSPKKEFLTKRFIVTHNTLLSMHISNNIAIKGTTVLFVNLEMTHAELTSRYMFINGGNDTEDFGAVACNTLFQVVDEIGWKDVDGLIKNAKEELDVGLVVIDHLHYLAVSENLGNEQLELTRAVKEFKRKAIKYDIPVILVSHIKRLSSEERLSMDSLKGSSSIGQVADIVLLVDRDPETNAMGVMVDKNRNRGKLSDRTKDWGGRDEREINTIYLKFNNTKLEDPMEVPKPIQTVFPGAQAIQIKK